MEEYKNCGKHVAVLAFPFGTHASPLLSLARRLSAAVPDAMFSFLSTKQSNSKLFPKGGETVEKIKPFNVWDGLPEGYNFSGNPFELTEYFVKALPGNFRKAIAELVTETGRPIDCLLTDAFYWFGGDIGGELEIPWVALWTAGPRPLLVHLDTDLIREQVGTDGPDPEKALDFLEDFSALRVADLPAEVMSASLDAPIPGLLHKMGHALPRAAAVIANSYEDLDRTVVNVLKPRFNNNFLNVGPFNLVSAPETVDDPHGCLEWLDQREPASVAYISYGSMMTPPPQELVAISEALEETDSHFLWSFRGNPDELFPEGFLERTSSKGKIIPWAPQQKVLQHPSVGVFVTHGGWNSVLESIIGGVPMILRPFFGDQKLNAGTVEKVWGFGMGLAGGNCNKEGATEALKLMLSSENGENMRQKIGVQKELALKAVHPDGTSVQNFQNLVMLLDESC